MSEIIHIYHTNDFHSHFENWPRIKEFLKKRKALHYETGEEALVLDIGDHLDRSHPYTEATLGKGNVALLNEAGYEYVTIGNNEGITLPHSGLDHLYDEASFKVLIANLYDENKERPNWALPYAIHTTKHGTNIAMVGVTAYFKNFYHKLGWHISEPYEELKKQLQFLKDKADIVIVLSHLGIHDDEKLAEEFPEIDIVLGGHTHHVLHTGKEINQALVCCAGKFGMFVGQVEIQLNEEGKVAKKKAYLYDTNDLPVAENETEWIKEVDKTGARLLHKREFFLPESLSSEWFSSGQLARILCEGLREWGNSDCAFVNAGLLMDSLPVGIVTTGDIHRICPHPINPCIVELTGAELKEILLQSRNSEWPHLQVKGFGFRGKVMGVMVYDQIEFMENKKGVIKKIFIKGKELKPRMRYKLAIPDMFTFGYFFPQIQRSDRKEYLMPEFLRDILLWKLKKIYSEV